MSACFGKAAVALFGVAARHLGWKPAQFWAATPAELIAALTPPRSESGLGRDELNRMMEHEHG